MARPPQDVLQLLGNPTNRTILSLLAIEPQYPRRLAEVVGLTEDEASRRLRAFAKVGLATASWANVGRTVRLYQLLKSRFVVSVTRAGLAVAGLEGAALQPVGPAAESPPAVPRFFGRAAELARLRDLFHVHRAVVVHGIGGAGKTTLAAHFAATQGRPVLWHTLLPGETGRLLLSRLATGARSLVAGAQAQRLLALQAGEEDGVLQDVLVEILEAEKVLVVLDRFEVSDEGCVDTAAELAQRLGQAGLLLVGRTFPKGLPRGCFASLGLDGLAREDAGHLLAALGVRLTPMSLDSIHRRTRGHPLSLVLVSMAPEDRRSLGVERLMEEAGIREFLLAEVIPQLAEPEREALLAWTVLREPFLLAEAEAVADTRHAANLLQRLEARGLVSRAGELYSIHDLVRSFLAAAVPQGPRVHSRAAQVLKASGEPRKVLEAIHHLLAANQPDAGAAIVREEAAQGAYRFIDLGLADRYRVELEALARRPLRDAAARAAIELELGVIDTFGGQSAPARAHLEAARGHPGRRRDALTTPLTLALARLHRLEGDGVGASRLYGAAEAAAEAAGDQRLLLEALVDHGSCDEERSDRDAVRAYERAMEVGRGTSEIRLLSLAYSGAARITARHGDERHLAWAEEGLRLARLAGFLRGEVSAYMTFAAHFMATEDTRMGLEHADRYLEVATRLGDPWFHACALIVKARLLTGVQQPEAALPYALEAHRQARGLRSHFYEQGAGVALADAYLRLGKLAEARAALKPLLEAAPSVYPSIVAKGWQLLAQVERQEGNKKAARKAAATARRIMGRRVPSVRLDDGMPSKGPLLSSRPSPPRRSTLARPSRR